MNGKEISEYLTKELKEIEELERKHGKNPRMQAHITERIDLLEGLVRRIGKILS